MSHFIFLYHFFFTLVFFFLPYRGDYKMHFPVRDSIFPRGILLPGGLNRCIFLCFSYQVLKPLNIREHRQKNIRNRKQIIKWHTSSNIPIITLNVNSQNTPYKRQISATWIKKYYLSICCLQTIQFKYNYI